MGDYKTYNSLIFGGICQIDLISIQKQGAHLIISLATKLIYLHLFRILTFVLLTEIRELNGQFIFLCIYLRIYFYFEFEWLYKFLFLFQIKSSALISYPR